MQNPKEMKIGARTITYPRPTWRTIVRASAAISKLPQPAKKEEIDNGIRVAVLRHARKYDSNQVGKIIAILLVGAKHLDSRNPIARHIAKARARRLAHTIEVELTPEEMQAALIEIIGQSGLENFFVVTTFLQGINTLKATRKVEETTTAHGQR